MSTKKLNILLLVAIVSFFVASCNNENTNQEQSALPYSVVKKLHRQELLDWNKGLVSIDYSVIQKFIERRKWDMQVTESGLYWQIYSQTDDIKAEDGLIALFSYKTSLLDGTLIYSSEEFGNRELHLGHNQDELGLNEGILMMKKGEKARFIMPPHLAFGVPGDGFRVPYYSVLVYEIELLDLYSPEQEVVMEDGWH
jgi:hypothetical protein